MDSINSGVTGQPAAPVSEATDGGEQATGPEDDASTTYGEDQWRWGGWHSGWSWNSGYSRYQGWNWSDRGSQAGSQRDSSHSLMEILPDFVQGWYLLHDSGLGASERNMIPTAVQGNYSLQRIAQELRAQWDESSLRQREGHGRTQASYMGDYDDAESEDLDHHEGFILEDMTEEGQALVAEMETDVQQALAVIQQGKRTLREARARQNQVRLSRQYFKTSINRGSGTSTTSTFRAGGSASGTSTTGSFRAGSSHSGRPTGVPDDSKMVCLKCGRVGHRAANCPTKAVTNQQAQMGEEEPTEHAPFICYSEQALSSTEVAAYLTTQEAVRDGWCVVDGGATKTLGSITAIQHILDKNQREHGQSRLLAVDTDRQPVFSFGNSSENKCSSTVHLGIQAEEKQGQLTIHALDAGEGPVLMSVSTLRALGAIIDFKEDLICFRSVDSQRLIRARRSQSGHQLLPLSGNMCEASTVAKCAIPSLKDFLP